MESARKILGNDDGRIDAPSPQQRIRLLLARVMQTKQLRAAVLSRRVLEHAGKVAAIVDILRRVVGRDLDADVVVYDHDIVRETAPGLKRAASKRK